MVAQSLRTMVLFGCVLGLVVHSGNADARHRCRGGRNGQWTTTAYNSGYYANSMNNGNYGVSPMNYGTTVYSNSTPPMATGVGASGFSNNGIGYGNNGIGYGNNGIGYGNNGNVYGAPFPTAPQQFAPAQPGFVGNGPATQTTVNRPVTQSPDPSPDADNSVDRRTTTPIPGANPAKAPAPPAAAVPD